MWKLPMPCRRKYWPVRMEARLQQQIETVTKWFLNNTPSCAIPSILGVRMLVSPMQPSVFQHWSSVRTKIILGRCTRMATKQERDARTCISFSTHVCHFHAEQFAKLVYFSSDMSQAHRAMMRRAMRVPFVHKLPRTGWKAVTAVGIADFQYWTWH